MRNEKVYTRVVIWMLLALLRIDLFASAKAKKILIEKNKQNRTKQNIRKVFTRVLLMWRCYIWNFYLSSLRWSQTDVIIWFYCMSVSIWSALRQISSNMLAVLILFNFVQKFLSFIMFLKNQILKVCSRRHQKCTFKLTFLDASYVKHQLICILVDSCMWKHIFSQMLKYC